MEGHLIDLDYREVAEGTEIILEFIGKDYYTLRTRDLKPYFYVEDPEGEERSYLGKKIRVKKVEVNYPKEVPKLKEELRDAGKEVFEYDIPFTRRYLIDKDIYCMKTYNEKLKEIKKTFQLKILSIDIEVYSRKYALNPETDPIIMISLYDGRKKYLLSWKPINLDYAVTDNSEEQMLLRFVELVNKINPDIILGFNSDSFDLPYIIKRLKKYGKELTIGRNGEKAIRRKTRSEERVEIPGRIHIDVFKMVDFLASVGSIRLPRYNLEQVYKDVLGKEKTKINFLEMNALWENGDLSDFGIYCMEDAMAAYEIGMEFLPLFIELSRVTGLPLYQTTRSSTSQLVEFLLMRNCVKRGELIPKMPKDEEVKARMRRTYKGGFVKEPVKGLHENIVEFDFRSMYPSIIVSHNIDPSTIDCECCKGKNVSPTGHWFCTKKKGLIPETIESLIKRRMEIKKKLKEETDPEKKMFLDVEQKAIKTITNAIYGYMGFPRARWYCRECAESIAAWGREYIQKAIHEAERHGFTVLYADTDGFYAKYDGNKNKVYEFLKEFNKKLPEPMELELENFYIRGIFVTKREGTSGAKKKYAMLDENGRLKIAGFELVRRDFAGIAKKVQEKVLEKILIENNVEGAVNYVREVINKLKNKEIPLEDLVIYTQITRELSEYESIGPHVYAIKRSGKKVVPGEIIGYIITKGSGSISERAYLVEDISNREPDPDYYIHHQIIPTVIRILGELGYTETDLLSTTKQEGLGKWMS